MSSCRTFDRTRKAWALLKFDWELDCQEHIPQKSIHHSSLLLPSRQSRSPHQPVVLRNYLNSFDKISLFMGKGEPMKTKWFHHKCSNMLPTKQASRHNGSTQSLPWIHGQRGRRVQSNCEWRWDQVWRSTMTPRVSVPSTSLTIYKLPKPNDHWVGWTLWTPMACIKSTSEDQLLYCIPRILFDWEANKIIDNATRNLLVLMISFGREDFCGCKKKWRYHHRVIYPRYFVISRWACTPRMVTYLDDGFAGRVTSHYEPSSKQQAINKMRSKRHWVMNEKVEEKQQVQQLKEELGKGIYIYILARKW